MQNYEASAAFIIGDEIEWEVVGDKVKRKILGFDASLMLVNVHFDEVIYIVIVLLPFGFESFDNQFKQGLFGVTVAIISAKIIGGHGLNLAFVCQ